MTRSRRSARSTSTDEVLLAAPLRVEALLAGTGIAGVRARHTGMGPRRAAAAAPALLSEPARALVVIGFAGGLLPALRPGDLVLAQQLRDPEGGCVPCPASAGLVELLRSRGLTVHHGPIACTERPVRGESRSRLHATGAIAVDMESVWLAAGAGERPLAVIRAIVDTPSRELTLTAPWLTVGGGLRAARSLRRAASALHEWVPGV